MNTVKNWWKEHGWGTKEIDWEEYGRRTAMECDDPGDALELCGHQISSLEAQHQPALGKLNRDIDNHRQHGEALRDHLYNRPVPVEDAQMLTHRTRTRTYLILALITLAAGFIGNFATFKSIDWGLFWSAVAALVITSLPLALGHIFYEHVIAGSRRAMVIAAIIIIAVTAIGYYAFGQARKTVADKAMNQSENTSFLDDSDPTGPGPAQKPQDSESKFQATFGDALFFLSVAAELASGFLVGRFLHLLTDEDFAAWRELQMIEAAVADLERRIAEILALIEMARSQCMAGIRHAQASRKKPKTPYYKALLVVALSATFGLPAARSQTMQNQEGILIDRSASIARKRSGEDLFQRYLRSAKRLLQTEPPNTHVWVSSIADDSFGGVTDLVSGQTPEAHGIFTDDLDHARRQLATRFEAQSANLTANSPGTDIFGGLWHLKVLFEASGSAGTTQRTIWIFSDMMNETSEFEMARMLDVSPEQMLAHVQSKGLIVPLRHYRIYVCGAVPERGVTPYAWIKKRCFWKMYFEESGAHVVVYSTACDVARQKTALRVHVPL